MGDKALRTLFLTKCPKDTTPNHFKQYYEPLGPNAVQRTKLVKKAGVFCGLCIVTFSSEAVLKRARQMPPPTVAGQQVNFGLDPKTYKQEKRIGDMLHNTNKRRRVGAEGQAQAVQPGQTLKPVKWTAQALKGTLFVKDLGRLILRQLQGEEAVKAFRQERNIQVSGSEVPNPIAMLSDIRFGVLLPFLRQQYSLPTPIQAQMWPVALRGRDCIGLSETGSGKTVAFTLPALLHLMEAQKVRKEDAAKKARPGSEPPPLPHYPVVLILVPSRELVLQIAADLHKYARPLEIQIGMAYGGQFGMKGDKKEQARDLMKGCDIVVATPGRLLEFVEARLFSLATVSLLVIDDADEMVGRSFIPQVTSLVGQLRPDRQTLLTSATWSTDVQGMAKAFLTNPVKVIVNRAEESAANRNVEHRVLLTTTLADKKARLVEIITALKAEARDQTRTFVFANSRKFVDEVAATLREHWPNVHHLHAGRTQQEREAALGGFRSDPHSILVATDLSSRGLDIRGLPCVINFQLAYDTDRLVQRIGRTGRAGAKGRAYSFLSEECKMDLQMAPKLVRVLTSADQPVDPELAAIAERTRQWKRARHAPTPATSETLSTNPPPSSVPAT
eukprot:GGOE01041765.1.p1 GENE.GGOE01041765.1~~GGOE01041765.1.p1  ORF type:complete len:632 (-),score=197.60 GGOE01041765.1:68-1912(-)